MREPIPFARFYFNLRCYSRWQGGRISWHSLASLAQKAVSGSLQKEKRSFLGGRSLGYMAPCMRLCVKKEFHQTTLQAFDSAQRVTLANLIFPGVTALP